jgi:hypothetical protein
MEVTYSLVEEWHLSMLHGMVRCVIPFRSSEAPKSWGALLGQPLQCEELLERVPGTLWADVQV